MKVVVAPQAFKGTLSAREAAKAMAEGVGAVWPEAEVVLAPVADGGDGTLEALVESSGGRYLVTPVTGPLGRLVRAEWGILGDGATAVLETARVCGLAMLSPSERDPRATTTCGLGELMLHAMDMGLRRFVIGLGGSATNDGGAGMAQAVGVSFLDAEGRELPRGGAALKGLASIDISHRDPRVKECVVIGATDVTNPLCGPEGASMVYGSQKGASPEAARELDGALSHLAAVAERDLGLALRDVPGAGAAGGLGFGLMAFLGGRLQPGAEVVFQAVKMKEKLEGADLVITGEGRLDASTAYNKAPLAVARLAKEKGVPCIAVVGSLGDGYEAVVRQGPFARIETVAERVSGVGRREQHYRLLVEATERALRWWFRNH
ncbi:MAG: glycerate kinase [Chloroflexi bacterium]|nr:glycerate kinase [Chloroflexota bacterium]